MDFKKAYKAMVQRARELHEGGNSLTKQQMEIVCPELAESEDERIRKEILDFIQLCLSWIDFGSRSIALHKEDTEMFNKWLAYLKKQKVNTDGDFARGYDCGYECCLNSHGAEWFEKQKEQKQSEMEKEYVRTLHSLISDFLRGKQEIDREYYQKIWDWLDNRHIEQKPAEWSEDDERMLNNTLSYFPIIRTMAEAKMILSNDNDVEVVDACCSWLKSLRPQSHWKPGEEQMIALKNIAYGSYQIGDGPVLRELYNNLKKL